MNARVPTACLKNIRDFIKDARTTADTAPSDAMKAWAYGDILEKSVLLLEETILVAEKVAAEVAA